MVSNKFYIVNEKFYNVTGVVATFWDVILQMYAWPLQAVVKQMQLAIMNLWLVS